jgi:hypothetical protein
MGDFLAMKLPFALVLALVMVGRAGPCVANEVRIVHTPNGGEVPDAEVDTRGAIHIAFVKGEDAYYAKSDNGGKSFSQPLRINSQPGTVHPANMFRGPDLALGQNGRVHVIWYVNAYQRKLPQDQWGVFCSHLDPGEKAFAQEVNLNHKPSDNYSLAADDQGHVAVVWMAGKLFVTESSDNGGSFRTQEISIADPCECCASRALFSKDGTLTIAYRDKAENIRDMHVITRTGSGADFQKHRLSSTPWRINACTMTGTFLSNQAAQTVAAWETMGDVFYARIGARDKAPKEIKVVNRGKWPVALMSADGTVLVSWKAGSSLSWQRFDSNDKADGSVESGPSPNVNRHAGVVSKDGTFVLID